MEETNKNAAATSVEGRLQTRKQVTAAETATYIIYFIGQNILYWLITNYLMFFYTDVIFLNPFTVAIIFLIAKVWDAINDPLFGMLVDKVHFKKAKFTPWIKASSFLLPLATVLVFSIPSGFATWVKILLAFVTYAVWDILYTVSDVPIFALTTALTDNIKERSNLVTFGRIGAMVGVVLIMVVAPIFIGLIGMWATAVILCIIALVTMIPVGYIAKERNVAKVEAGEEQHGIREMLTYLKGNKYLLIFFGSFCIHGIFKVTFTTYVATYLLGGIEMSGIIAAFALPMMIFVYILTPILTKRFDRMLIYKVSIVASIALGIIQFFAGYSNIVVFGALSALRAFAEGFAGLLMFTFSGDAVEYGHYKTGIRKEGITFSLQTFSAKFTAAIASVLTALVLAVIGYSGGAVVTEGMKTWIWAASSLLPILGAAISLPVLMKYKLREKDVQIMADINNGKLEREEGEKLFSQKY